MSDSTMATQTLAPADTVRRTRLLDPRPRRLVLVPLTLAVASLLTQGFAQAVTPFIRQDDWTFLLPDRTRGVAPPSYYNISEGRWLDTAWWFVIGQHGTPTTAALTYAVGYAVLVAGMWRVLHLSGVRPGPVVDVLLGIALFASAVWVQLVYWPGALTPSIIVAATAIWVLPWAARSGARLRLWLLAVGVAAVLTYPPVGVVLLAFAIVFLGDVPWRRLLAVVGTWVAAFGLGVGVAYTLNWIVNQHFGLKVASWRQPNPLTSLDALLVNTGRWLDAAGSLWTTQWWVALVGLVAIALGWRDATVRPRLQRLLVAFGVACGLDAAQTLATGIVTEARGQLWTWLFAVLPVSLLLVERRPRVDAPSTRGSWVERTATLLLAVLAVGGVLSWRADIGQHQATRMQYAAIAEAATARTMGMAPPTVVVYQDPRVRNTRDGRLMASTMFMAVRQEQGGILPRWCKGLECRELAAHPQSDSVVHLGTAASGHAIVGIIVPTPPGWL
ncbi:hypothetical protein N865_08560 [Intrasporangium oryzae NRRL B-24470]|uniref:Uncharacterized protein n=1 Tax=Intrasporangium oryzae NRRL B-24470 TaxID=1386089 RepID=W9G977_9MICO|nr:hypothetical protein [Intrasporangium oryzae]EWT01388.1 hypothetical protein N865_08560 [Intrasporangium oryzae NRRL B-24470]